MRGRIISLVPALLGLLWAPGEALARLYQWVDPVSGVTQLSGRPPAWYQSEASGPRTLVFQNGALIDDTAIPRDTQQRQLLRAQAFDERVDTPAARPAVTAATDAAPTEAAPATPSPADATAAVPANTAGPDATIDRLRGVLAAWDAERAAQARAYLEQTLPETEPSPQTSR